MNCRALLLVPLLATLLAGFCSAAEGEYVSKEEFQKFMEEFNRYKATCEQLKVENAVLKQKVDNFASTSKSTPIGSDLSKYVTKDAFESVRNDVDTVRSGSTKLLIGGAMDTGFTNRKGEISTFGTDFHPLFLWKLSDEISFETDFEQATASYHIHDELTLQAGRFLTPVGRFLRGQRESWMNRLPDRPLAFDEQNGLVPETTLGAMLNGAVDAGPTKFNWLGYVANGPTLNAFDPQRFGSLGADDVPDNNQGKALGGRLGFLPVPQLEVGGSVYGGRAGHAGTPQHDVNALLAAADLNYVRSFDAVKGSLDFKSEWVWSRVGNATYLIDGNDVPFNNNRRNAGYARLAYRPFKINQKWVKNLEFALRYDRLENPRATADTPVEALPQRGVRNRWTSGLDYWLGPTTVVKFAYEDGSTHDDRAVLFQFAIGF